MDNYNQSLDMLNNTLNAQNLRADILTAGSHIAEAIDKLTENNALKNAKNQYENMVYQQAYADAVKQIKLDINTKTQRYINNLERQIQLKDQQVETLTQQVKEREDTIEAFKGTKDQLEKQIQQLSGRAIVRKRNFWCSLSWALIAAALLWTAAAYWG